MRVSAAPNSKLHHDLLTTRLEELSSSVKQDSEALPLREILLKELNYEPPRFLKHSLTNQGGLCDVVYDAAKHVVIASKYERTINEQEILKFEQDVQHAAVADSLGNRYIDLSKLYSILSQSPLQVRKLFNVKVFNELVRNSHTNDGTISCCLLSEFMAATSRRLQQHLLLRSVAKSSDHITANEFLDLILSEVAYKLTWQNELKDTPFYYAVFIERSVFFHFDPHRVGKIRISDLASTRLMDDIFEVVSQQKRESSKADSISWCSTSRFSRTLEQFRDCDRTGTGMLSLEEVRSLRGGALTPLFLERVFATQMLYGDRELKEMDFRGFVDLDVAITQRNQPASIKWLFRVIDLREDGVICRAEIKMMVDSMLMNLSAAENYPIAFIADDIVDEIIDMIHPADVAKISVEEVIASKMGNTIFGILIDYNEFLKYDRREDEQQDRLEEEQRL